MVVVVPDVELSIETDPSARDVEALAEGLSQHALPFTGARGFQPLAVLARDGEGQLVGGASGLVNRTWLHVSLLWVPESLRHQGLGSRLLGVIEAAAVARGCIHAHLDTSSCQARPFYEHHGYAVFAVLEDYPPGERRIFLSKRLGREPAR